MKIEGFVDVICRHQVQMPGDIHGLDSSSLNINRGVVLRLTEALTSLFATLRGEMSFDLNGGFIAMFLR
jgi:hypothetical protein